jgi:endonuclease/exonuclease/phosphatase family metal-dependent hydrolase
MRLRRLTCLGALVLATACARPVRIGVPTSSLDCRVAPSTTVRLEWLAPDDVRQRRRLDRWCAGVGPPDVRLVAIPDPPAVGRIAVVSWNVHVGQGDVLRLVDDLRGGRLGPAPDAIVLLLQEAWRTGVTVPRVAPREAHAAARIAPPPGAPAAVDIGDIATRLGWSLAYVPSMRNGWSAPGGRGEDRGTAVLSSLPFDAPHAVELPVERQRRVAVGSRVAGVTPGGRRWALRVVSVHLENRPGAGRAWIRAAAARTRQVQALLLALAATDAATRDGDDPTPVLLGGDLNTWRGRRENALRLLRRALPAEGPDDERPTFGRWRLDYLFGRLPHGTTLTRRRLEDAYGSDHHPVVAEIDFRGMR